MTTVRLTDLMRAPAIAAVVWTVLAAVALAVFHMVAQPEGEALLGRGARTILMAGLAIVPGAVIVGIWSFVHALRLLRASAVEAIASAVIAAFVGAALTGVLGAGLVVAVVQFFQG